jgi:hypothetical protein
VTARVAAVLVVVLAGIAAGCGGDEENATQEWANDVCTELNTWVESIQDTVQGLTDQGLSIRSSDVEAAVEDAKGATDDLVSGLESLGPPETEAGQQAKSELDQLGATLQTQLAGVARAANENPQPLQLVETVGAAVSAAAAAARSTFETIESLDVDEELKDAFEDAESCDTLRDTLNELG